VRLLVNAYPARYWVGCALLLLTSLVVSFGSTAAQSPSKEAKQSVAETEGSLDSLDPQARRVLAVQVALDRAGFSPGVIDATTGGNTDRALRAYQEARRLDANAQIDDRLMTSLGEVVAYPVASYAINSDDLAGPFVQRVPEDMMDKAKLPTLTYTSVLELLSERFHASPKLLQRLNPNATFTQGDIIFVPNVEAFQAPGLKTVRQQTSAAPTGAGQKDAARAISSGAPAKGVDAVTVIVTESTKTLTVENAAGETILHAPVTVGSANDPLPEGEWNVNGVSVNPPFNYNPNLFWDRDPSHAKAKIPPGPNNPVGVVWIDLSKEHYGIHGTPEPSRIGYTQSHGCIRLTNWDAMRLAALVMPGTKVTLRP